MMSAQAAGIPKITHSCSSVPELIPLTRVLPLMGISLWCVWAVYAISEPPDRASSTMKASEVVVEAAEPPKVEAHTAVSPEAMVPAAVSPEVAAYATEPLEAVVLTSVPWMAVASSNAPPAHVTVELTTDELSQSRYGITV